MKIKCKRTWIGVFALLWLLGATSCVEREEFRAWQGEVRRTTTEQSQQIRALNERLTTVEQQIATQDGGKQLADHLNNFTLLQEEVASLRGQVEMLSHRRETQIQELEVFKQRLEQQPRPGGELPPTAPQVAAAVPQPAPQPEAVDREEELYKEARFSFEEGDYKKAREMFSALLQRYPDSSLVDNAQFWVGECFFREGNFKQAILEYEKMISQYPQSLKVPSAYLKQGMAFEKLGDAESARFLYSKITKDYPDSDQAPMATHRLKNLP